MSELIDKLFVVHESLKAASLPHAFGGAIALAYCTHEPRGTRDLDVNIFVDAANAAKAIVGLPKEVVATQQQIKLAKKEGQVRLWWGDTPVDIFLNNHPLHEVVAQKTLWVPLQGREIPILDAASLVVFKALFNRTKDWADIEAVAEAAPEQIKQAAETLAGLLGESDPSCERLNSVLNRSS